MNDTLAIHLTGICIASACAIPGVFLVLRRMSLMSDAIGHAVLPGIIIMYLLVKDLGSPLLVIGAVIMGVITVTLTEILERTKLVKEDAAIGTVFPVLFSIGVILATKYTSNVHLDEDAVMVGNLGLAILDTITIGSIEIPKSLILMGSVFVIDLVLLIVFFKELKLSTFDAGLATALGFSPVLVHYGLMLMTSITVVGAFSSVGPVLVVALIIAPPAAAYMLTDRLWLMIVLSVVLGSTSSVLGCLVADRYDLTHAGCIAGVTGGVFLFAVLFAPKRGIIAGYGRNRRQKLDFGVQILLVHLFNHEGSAEEAEENRAEHLSRHVSWKQEFANRIVGRARRRKLIGEDTELLSLTDDGREEAIRTMEVYY